MPSPGLITASERLGLRRGRQNLPPRIVIHGTHGIGKSTLAASAPNPIFIPTESGGRALDVAYFFGDRQPVQAGSEQDVLDCIRFLVEEKHDFETVVVDTADWLEMLIHQGIAASYGAATISGTGKKNDPLGFGKGYSMALNNWRFILDGLDYLNAQKGMIIFLLAHSQIIRFDDPLSASYDRYQLDLHKASSAILAEWCDILGFFNIKARVEEEDVGFNKRIHKAKADALNTHILYLEETPGFVAKNRYGMPASLFIPKVNGWDTIKSAIIEAQK